MDDMQFGLLLSHLGLSWQGYRKVRKGVKKRVRRHMRTLNCLNMADYLLELDRLQEIRDECELLLTVPISRFFRDKKLWEVLKDPILPEIIKDGRRKISVWSAGCACGEEVYSLKILWRSLTCSAQRSPELEIIATDMNPKNLERAGAGRYPASSLRELPVVFKSTCFIADPAGNFYKIKPSLKSGISWHVHNLQHDPPEKLFDMIFLRNSILTYCHEKIRIRVLRKVLKRLRPGGFFITGSHEVLPFVIPGLHPFGPLSFVFKKG